jgi:hypothetical protein
MLVRYYRMLCPCFYPPSLPLSSLDSPDFVGLLHKIFWSSCHSSSWETSGCKAIQEISHISWNPEVSFSYS